MGKQDFRSKLLESGRLSGLSKRTNGAIKGGSGGGGGGRFDSRVDARLKLQLKQKQSSTKLSGISDARLLLAKKRINTTLSAAATVPLKSKITDARQLLMSKRKQQLIKQQVITKNKDKQVRSDGITTLVTLKNNLHNNSKTKSRDDDADADYDNDDEYRRNNNSKSRSRSRMAENILEVDRSESSLNKNAKYQPIRIKIDNTSAYEKMSTYLTTNHHRTNNTTSSSISSRMNDDDYYYGRSSSLSNNSHGIMMSSSASNYNQHHHRENDSMSMDVDSPPASRRYQDSYYHNHHQSSSGSSSSSSTMGHRLFISNLHARVTEDDVLELFSDIGPIKRARFLEKGLAEVVYVKLEHAKEAIHKYDRNELDGRAMKIELITSNRPSSELAAEKRLNSSSSLSRVRSKSPPMNSSSSFRSNNLYSSSSSTSQKTASSSSTKTFYNTPTQSQVMPKDSLSNRFKIVLANKEAYASLHSHETKKSDMREKISVDPTIIHQVLFNKKQNANSRPVTFTVKL